jgi:SAM-dependent methyltransferase
VRWSPDGIPLLVSDVEGYLASIEDDLDAPLDALRFASLAYLSRYVPQLLAPRAPLRRALRGLLERHLAGPVGLAVELGCSVGADLRTLRAFAREVIGVDLSLVALRAAKTQLAGAPLPYLIRVEGRSFRVESPIALAPADGIVLAVGNALDPPLFPEVADVVVAMNLLDSVSRPLALIGQMDAVLKPGGLLLLASPLSWNESITPSEEALGGGTAPAWAKAGTPAGLVELLAGRLPILPHLRYDVLETCDVPWTVREHARAVMHYDVHLLAARKRMTEH